MQRLDQTLPFGLVGRVHPEPVRQPVPVLRIECDRRFLPEVSAELGGNLEDDEPVSPRREPALPAKSAELAGDGQQRVGGGLMGKIIEFRAGDRMLPTPATQFAASDPQQHLVQPRQGLLPHQTGAFKGAGPVGRLRVELTTLRGPGENCGVCGAVGGSGWGDRDFARLHDVERTEASCGATRLHTGKTKPRPAANQAVTTTNEASTHRGALTDPEALSDRVALVTGGGRGIGQAIALQLTSAGARVVVLARSADELNHTVALAAERGGRTFAQPADVSDPVQVAAALALVAQRWGPVEVLINNAAVVWPLGPSATLDPDEWARAVDVNVTAAARLSFALLPAMLEQGWGRIVNISSGIAAHPAGMLRANAYATSKAALEAHTLNLAAELADTGVTVNVFRPGGVDTAMQAWIRDQRAEHIGAELHDRFTRNYQDGTLLSPQQSASSLLARLPTTATAQIWDAADPT